MYVAVAVIGSLSFFVAIICAIRMLILKSKGRDTKKQKILILGCSIVCIAMLVITPKIDEPTKNAGDKDSEKQEETTQTDQQTDNSEDEDPDDYDYVSTIQKMIQEQLYPNAEFSWISDVLVWDNGGFTEVKNTFTLDGDNKEHQYHARFAGKDLVYLTVDDQKIFSDIDKMTEFMDSMDK